MPRDVMLFKLAREVESVAEVETRDLRPLGSKPEVLDLLIELFPHIDLTNPGWACVKKSDYAIEFNVRRVDDPIAPGLIASVYGGERALEALDRLQRRTGWYALDCAAGEFMKVVEGW